MIENLDYIILEKYLIQATNAIKGSVSSRYRINFRCNICGDSATKRHVKRGFLLFNTKDPTNKYWVYKCQRPQCDANAGWSAQRWLKHTDPFLYNCYINEVKALNRGDENADAISAKLNKIRLEKEKDLEADALRKKVAEEKDVKFFKPINSKGKLFEDARTYCIKRKIPESIWSKFFVATDRRYKNRLIIPFFNKSKEILYWQGRHLYGEEPKYLNRMVDKSNAIYNLDNIDETKPVVVLEGPIDSMFVENAIATLGLELNEKMQRKIDTLDAYYLFDNDEAGQTKSRKYLKNNKYVFLWKSFLKDYELPGNIKDINEVILQLGIDNFKFIDLKKYFTNSYIDLLYF